MGPVRNGYSRRMSVAIDLAGPGVAVAAFKGESDRYDAEIFRRELTQLAEAVPILIDLTGATFIDSAVAGALIETLRDAEEMKVGFGIVLPGDSGQAVRKLFEVTGLIRLLPVFDSREAALAALGVSG
jgi:anti-anti-sigma factor